MLAAAAQRASLRKKASARINVRCSGEIHVVAVVGKHLVLADHTKADLRTDLLINQIARIDHPGCRCAEIRTMWRDSCCFGGTPRYGRKHRRGDPSSDLPLPLRDAVRKLRRQFSSKRTGGPGVDYAAYLRRELRDMMIEHVEQTIREELNQGLGFPYVASVHLIDKPVPKAAVDKDTDDEDTDEDEAVGPEPEVILQLYDSGRSLRLYRGDMVRRYYQRLPFVVGDRFYLTPFPPHRYVELSSIRRQTFTSYPELMILDEKD